MTMQSERQTKSPLPFSAFHASGIKSLKKLHEATTDEIRKILRKAVPFAT